jgi:chemotaxis protein histidine kinase CheA
VTASERGESGWSCFVRPSLFTIFSDEATQRLADLDAALSDMAGGLRPAAWEAFIRAAHTLAGISRTTGFMPLAEAAHEVELWGSQWSDKTVPLDKAASSGRLRRTWHR